jgi:hypothetical protein
MIGRAISLQSMPTRRARGSPLCHGSGTNADAFIREFNAERSHEALGMKCPAAFCVPSPRCYAGLPELT